MPKLTPVFYGFVRDGRLLANDPEKFRAWLSSLHGDVQITVERRKHQRGHKQNAYYWGVVVKLVAEEIGILPEEAHDMMKERFLKVPVEHNGKRLAYVRSTTSLDTQEFGEYVEAAKRWASQELGIYIPEPGEVVLDHAHA
jgi:hypothetical protein